MRVIKEEDGTTFIMFDNFKELEELFMIAYHELELDTRKNELLYPKGQGFLLP